jgi:hypothetical protein
VAGVSDKPFSQLTLLSGEVVQARQSTYVGTYDAAWRAGLDTALSWLS